MRIIALVFLVGHRPYSQPCWIVLNADFSVTYGSCCLRSSPNFYEIINHFQFSSCDSSANKETELNLLRSMHHALNSKNVFSVCSCTYFHSKSSAFKWTKRLFESILRNKKINIKMKNIEGEYRQPSHTHTKLSINAYFQLSCHCCMLLDKFVVFFCCLFNNANVTTACVPRKSLFTPHGASAHMHRASHNRRDASWMCTAAISNIHQHRGAFTV